MNSNIVSELCFLVSTGFFLIALRIILPVFAMKVLPIREYFGLRDNNGIVKRDK